MRGECILMYKKEPETPYETAKRIWRSVKENIELYSKVTGRYKDRKFMK